MLNIKSQTNYNDDYDDADWREFEQMDESELVWDSQQIQPKSNQTAR